jgi:hypothetical protein
MLIKSPQWERKDYIKSRTEYWMENGLIKRYAVECATEDWYRYCEKYSYDPE